MAEIDNLSIQISANADSAEKSINNLIDSLRKLNQNLALGNVSKFASQMREITESAKGLKEVSSSISSIAKAGRDIGSLSGYKTVNDQIRETESETKKLAKSIADAFNFKSNGTEAAKENIASVTQLIDMMFYKLSKNKDISEEADMFSRMLPNMEGFKSVLDQNYQSVKAFTDQYKIFVDETKKESLEHTYETLTEAGKAFNVMFSAKDGKYVLKNIEEYLTKLKEISGMDFMPKGDESPTKGLERLRDYLKSYEKDAKDAADHVLPDADFYKLKGEELAKAVEDAYKRIHAVDTTKNPFAGIVEGMRSLQEITIPDFSGLNTLADAITRLNGVNTKNLKEIAKALNGMESVKATGAPEQLSMFTNMAQEVGKSDKPLKDMADNAEKAGNAIALLVDKSYGFKNIGDFLNTGADAFKRISDAIAQDMIKNMHFDLVDTGKVTFESFRDAVEGVASSFQLMRSAFQGSEEDVIDITNSFRELRDSIGTTADDIKLIGTAMQESADDIKNFEDFQPPAIKMFTGDIEGEGRKLGDQFKRGFENGLDGVEDIIDGTFRDIVDSINNSNQMDGFSRMMRDVLLDIEKYSSIISGMKKNPDIFDAAQFEEATKKLKEAKDAWETFERTTNRNTRLGISREMSEASKEAQRLQERIHDLKRMMSDMDNEKTIVNVEQYRAWAKELEKIQARYDELMGKKKEVEKSGGNLNLLANLIALGHEIGNIANAFDRLANFGIKGLKLAFKPLEEVVEHFKSRIDSIKDTFKGFVDSAKKQLDKLSAFWKRSMKTFTFMLVRKAITAVITEMSDAIKSLALWSKQFGTIFNDSMSQITSNFSYIARSIVGAFEPIINYLVPAFNALADAIARAAGKLGEFFAAMTGQGYYMAAKRQVTDYAESVDKANKAQKNLIAGLDDLNVITTPTSTQNGMDDLAAQWEKVDVSDKMKDWVKKIKDLAKRLFDPIKKAWDKTKDHVIGGWKYMTGEIKKLLKDIGRDFLKVWEQPATQKIFENIFNTIGNIEEAIGHLARNFREAWNYNDNGLHILENIRDIILNISEHVLNMSEAFKKWADDLDFKPLLSAVEEFTRKVQPLIDFLGNLIEDWWERVILRHWKWLIEVGVPHLLKTIGEVIDAFNFDKIRKDLQPVMDAFETMRENIETGIVDAFGNLGKAVADFANSEDFSKFTQNVAWFMEQITAERVEKLFTALGTAILNVAESLMRFVGSDKFRDFMTKLFEWYDKLSVDDIAGFIQKIAFAIGLFKFTAFVGKGFAGFLSFLSILTSGKGILSIAGDLLKGLAKGIAGLFGEKGLGGLFKGAGKGIAGALAGLIPKEGAIAEIFATIGSALSTVGSVVLGGALILAIVTAVSFVINNWDKIAPVLSKLSELIFKGIGMALGGLAKFIGEQIAGALSNIGKYFAQQAEECGGNIILGIIVGIGRGIKAFVEGIYNYVVKPFIDGFKAGFGIHSPATTMIPIGEFLIEGLLEGIKLIIGGIGEWLYTNVVQPIIDFFAGAAEWLIDGGKAIIEGIKNGIDAAKEGLAAKWDEIKEDAGKAWKRICEDAEEWWGTIKDTVHGLAEDLRKNLEDKWNEVKQNGIDAWEQFKTDASDRWDKIRTTIHDIAKDLRRKLYERWEDIKREGARAWDSFKTTAQQKWQSIRDAIVNLANNIKTMLDGVWNNIKTAAEQAWNTIKTNAESIWNNIRSSAETIWGNIKGTIVGFAQRAAEEASYKFWDLVGWASDAFRGVLNSASNILSGLGRTISDSVGDLWSMASNWGKNILSGLTSGLNDNSGWNNIKRSVSLLGDAVNTVFRKKEGIFSPSRVFEEYGGYIVEGLNEGIEKNAKSTQDSMNKWTKAITMPKFNLDAAVPKSSLKMDSYQHTDFTGTATFDQGAMQASMRSAIQESIGSLVLPYLSDIANSSRETANKNLTISAKDVHTAVRVEDKRFKTQTGRSAFAY